MAKYIDLSDMELLALYRAGDQNAFSSIFHKYWPVLIVHANNMVKDQEIAEDVVQEVFAGIYSKADTLEFTHSLSSYLYSSVRYGVLGIIKKKKAQVNYLESLGDYFEKNFDLADDNFNVKELSKIIEEEIERMPPKMREIFELSRKQHLSHKEIATKLDLSEHTVRNQIKRALILLKNNKNIRPYLIIATIHFFH